MTKFIYLYIVIMLVLGIMLGYFLHILLEYYNPSLTHQQIYNGCWASVTSPLEKRNWICVNIDGMEYEEMVKICVHEASHEMFARNCEGNPESCFKAMEIIENGQK